MFATCPVFLLVARGRGRSDAHVSRTARCKSSADSCDCLWLPREMSRLSRRRNTFTTTRGNMNSDESRVFRRASLRTFWTGHTVLPPSRYHLSHWGIDESSRKLDDNEVVDFQCRPGSDFRVKHGVNTMPDESPHGDSPCNWLIEPVVRGRSNTQRQLSMDRTLAAKHP